MKKNIIICGLIVLNLITLFLYVQMKQDYDRVIHNGAQTISNIQGESENWKITKGFRFEDASKSYFYLGDLEYKGSDSRKIKSLKSIITVDDDPVYIFENGWGVDFNLLENRIMPLGSASSTGEASKVQKNIENQKMLVTIEIIFADGVKQKEQIAVKGDYNRIK